MTEDLPADPEDARDEGREALLKEVAVPAPKRKRRWILRLALALPPLLALLVFLLPTILSMGWVTRKIEAAAGEKLARRVTLESHSVGWWAPVTCEKLVVYEKDGTTPFLRIDKVVAKLPLKPLLDRNVELESLEITGVEARIVRRRDGSLSTDDLGEQPAPPPSTEPAPAPAPQPAPAPEGGRFRMGRVAMREVSVRFVDETTGRTATATGLTLDAKPGATPDEIVAEVKSKIDVSGAATGTLEAQATLLALDAGRPRAEITGNGSLKFGGLDLAAVANALQPEPGREFRTGACEGTVAFRLDKGGDRTITVDARLPGVVWGDAGQPATLQSPVTVHQALALRNAGRRIDIREMKITLAGADLQVQGSIDLPADDGDTDNPVDLVARFDGETSHFDELFPASVGGQIHKGPLRSTWNIRGKNTDRLAIDGVAEVTSYVFTTVDEAGKESHYKVPHPGFLKFEAHGEVDLKRRELRAAETGRAWASLDGISLDLEMRAPWIQSAEVDLKQIWMQLSVREQVTDIRTLEFILNDGEVRTSGRVLFDAEDPAWTIANRGTHVAYSYVFSKILGLLNPALYATERGQIEADLGWEIDLAGRGFDMERAKKTLTGRGKLALERGTISGSPMLGELFKQLRIGEAAKYEFDGMAQEFRIAEQKVHNEWSKWQGAGKEADLTIAGWTDFEGNMQQRITVEGDPTTRWGKTTGTVVDVLNKAGGLPLGGTVDSPKIDIDYEKALKGAIGGIIEDPKLQEKGRSLLEDLFGKKKKK
ncbi:MAG: hypothetical protein HYY18_00720 [Planctomycetes bacterium]|nr:hypothetical protein [Planctomycetota bacterium]